MNSTSLRNRAFTFLEVLVVVSILGIIILVSFPVFAEFVHEMRKTEFSNSVFMSFKAARMNAIENQRLVRAKIELGSSTNFGNDTISFEICPSPANDSGNCPVSFKPFSDLNSLTPSSPIVISEVCKSGSNNGYTTGTHYIRFNSHGSIHAECNSFGESPYIQITTSPIPSESKRCSFRTVRIDNVNGFVKLYSYRRDPGEDINSAPINTLPCRQ